MIKKTYNYLKEKAIRFKKWLVILIFGAAVLAAPLVLPNVPDVALEKIQADYNVSQLKDKYRLEKTAFILDAVDENAIQTEVGNKNSDEFLPELTLRKWDDEVSLKVKHKHNEKKKDLKFELDGEKIKLKGKKIETHFYEMENAYEFEIILLEKPDVNVVGFDIEAKGLKFYYQPELTQKEKDDGCHRPENVIGSYAVYHESKQGDYSKMGKKNYRAGKAFHIYRPKIIDNAGKEVWGKLNITDNLLTVEIPQEFLDNAVYPVRHAAGLTFGCDPASPGASENYIDANEWKGSKYTGAAGTVTGMSAYVVGFCSHNAKLLLVKDSDKNILTNGITSPIAMPTDEVNKWINGSFSNNPTSENVDYWLGAILDTSDCSIFYGDSGNIGDGGLDSSNNYASPTNPTDGNFTAVWLYSIYCTYTAGGAERRMFLTQ